MEKNKITDTSSFSNRVYNTKSAIAMAAVDFEISINHNMKKNWLGKMKKLTEIKKIIAENKQEILDKFAVKEIGIFGSTLTDEQSKNSDVDILVEFSRPVGFIHFMRLENYLSDLLQIKVDLVTKEALKPYIGKLILQDVVYV
ncbi:MAG TPA: nucleotidyltransferase family protein [Acidobacteriota bacterium]|nr:nucleotidyltransferase family protein [Acidobacteriota bacterium]